MRLIVLSTTAILVGSLFVVYGTLLAWRPVLFLKFHDTFIDRGQWNRNAAWRKSLGSLGARVTAASFVTFGLLIIYITLTKLIWRQN